MITAGSIIWTAFHIAMWSFTPALVLPELAKDVAQEEIYLHEVDAREFPQLLDRFTFEGN